MFSYVADSHLNHPGLISSPARKSLTSFRKIVFAVAAGTFSLGAVLTASSAVADVTPLSMTVQGGALSISVPTSSVNLGTIVDSVSGSVLSGSLGQVQVLDARSASAGSGWVMSVIASALTPPAGPTIGAARIGYTAGTIAKVGTATYTANNPGSLASSVPAVTATGITGNNSATWSPTINVNVPGSTAAAVYTGTITHSVL